MDSFYHYIGNALATVAFAFCAAFIAKCFGFFKPKRRPSVAYEIISLTDHQQVKIIEECRRKTGAIRCYLTKMHNGEYFVDGSEILRKSRVVEAVAPGVTYEAARFRNILVSTVLDEMEYAKGDGPGWFVTRDLPLSNFRQINEETGVVAGARVALKKRGKIVGFIGLDFDSDEPPKNLHEINEYAGWMESTL